MIRSSIELTGKQVYASRGKKVGYRGKKRNGSPLTNEAKGQEQENTQNQKAEQEQAKVSYGHCSNWRLLVTRNDTIRKLCYMQVGPMR